MGFKNILLLILLGLVYQASAQLRIPSFDVSLKGGILNLDSHSPDKEIYTTYLDFFMQSEINLHLGQRFAIGWFYSRNITHGYEYDERGRDAIPGNSDPKNVKHLFYGANFRVSGGRGATLRPYANVKFFLFEAVVEYDGYNLAVQHPGAAAGVGLMIKLNRKMYLDFPEIQLVSSSVHDTNEDVIFNNPIIITITAGLTYNFSKRRR